MMRLRHSFAFAGPAAALLSGCGAQPQIGLYALPIETALLRLEDADIDGFRKYEQCGLLIHFSHETRDDAVTWRVKSSGREMARFTVRLTAEGQGTRATIEVPAAPGGGEIYDGNQDTLPPAIMQPLRPAVQELIDSAMEQRAFDRDRTPDRTEADQPCASMASNLAAGSPTKLEDFFGKPIDRDALEDREAARQRREVQIRDFGRPMMQPGERY